MSKEINAMLKEFSDGFYDDLAKVKKMEYYSTMVPYFLRDFMTRINNLHFCFRQSIITFDEYESFLPVIKDIRNELKKMLELRIVWQGERLSDYLPNASYSIIICNAYNDLFTDFDFDVYEASKKLSNFKEKL